MRRINKKGAAEGMDILVILIVGLVALALLLSIIFRADLLNWMRNLPDYGKPDEDKIIDIGSDDVIDNVASCEKVGELVYVKTGTGFWSGVKRAVVQKSYDVYINEKPTEIAVYNDEGTLDIRIYEGIAGMHIGRLGNNKIGQIVNQKILIDDIWINDASLREDHQGLPSVEDLKLIDDGYLGKTGLDICKKIEKVEVKK